MVEEKVWELAQVIHQAKIDFCFTKGTLHLSSEWPMCTRFNYGHFAQPWSDIAIMQAKAVLEHLGENNGSHT